MSAGEGARRAAGFYPGAFCRGCRAAHARRVSPPAGACYEARWGVGLLAAQRRNFAAPLWSGSAPLDGKTILLHAERGSGDTIQFARYAPRTSPRAAQKFCSRFSPKLVGLMHSLDGVTAVIARGSQLLHFDFHCPLLSLPLAFATELATIPARIPYLALAERDVARWHIAAGAKNRWSGSSGRERAFTTTISVARSRSKRSRRCSTARVCNSSACNTRCARRMRPICARAPARSTPCGSFSDFADTAALIAQLDAVDLRSIARSLISPSQLAMGKPLPMLLLPFAADFRWLRERSDSPWYPTARLFRQPRFGELGERGLHARS